MKEETEETKEEQTKEEEAKQEDAIEEEEEVDPFKEEVTEE